MPVISKKNALELQRIVKEVTSRDLTLPESFALLNYLGKIIEIFSPRALGAGKSSLQKSLFEKEKKV